MLRAVSGQSDRTEKKGPIPTNGDDAETGNVAMLVRHGSIAR